MKKITVLSLLIVVSILVSVRMPFNVAAQEPDLNQMLWDGLPFHELSDMESGWVPVYGSLSYVDGGLRLIPNSNGKITAKYTFTDPIDIKRCNPAFRLKITGPLPSYLTFRMIFIDTANKKMYYNFYNKANSLQGSEDYRIHFISWVDPALNYTGFHPAQIKQVELIFYSNSDQWAPVFDDLRAYPEVNLYDQGYVIITSDGTRPGLSYLSDKLDEYGYKFSPGVENARWTNETLIRSWYNRGHDPQLYVRLFELSDPTVLLSPEEIYRNTVEAATWLQTLCPGQEVVAYHCNRHLSDERINAMFPDKIIKGSGFNSSSKIAQPFTDFYGSTRDTTDDLHGISNAANTKTGYIEFDHGYAFNPSISYIKTPEQVDQMIDHINTTGCKVVTWTEYRNDILTYLGNPPDPTPSEFFTVELSDHGFNIIENGVIVEHFDTALELINYVTQRALGWEN